MIPYGLYIVGARERDVRDHASGLNAFVATWVTQTSFKPPMVVMSVKANARSHRMILESGVFTLNVLGTGQKALATKFFKDLQIEQKGADEGTMSGVPYRVEPKTGCPVLPELPGWVACEVEGALEQGRTAAPDHTPILARVVDAGFRGPAEALTEKETGWQYGG